MGGRHSNRHGWLATAPSRSRRTLSVESLCATCHHFTVGGVRLPVLIACSFCGQVLKKGPSCFDLSKERLAVGKERLSWGIVPPRELDVIGEKLYVFFSQHRLEVIESREAGRSHPFAPLAPSTVHPLDRNVDWRGMNVAARFPEAEMKWLGPDNGVRERPEIVALLEEAR